MFKDSDDDKAAFRNRLTQLRILKRLTQYQLAERAGVPPAAVSHFETGFRFPAPLTLQKLATALEVTIDHLMGSATPPTPVGPRAEAIFRDFHELSDASQEQLLQMTKLLREMDEKRRAGK